MLGLCSIVFEVSSISVRCWFRTDEIARATCFAKVSKLVLFFEFCKLENSS
jgi:hypothetical protein